MSFASLDRTEVDQVIETFANADDLTVVVGAGASMESDLSSWPALIRALLTRVANAVPALTEEDERAAWIDLTLERDDLLAAGAVVEVMAPEPLGKLIPAALYGSVGAGGYLPGPIARQVASLCLGAEQHVEILTTNYDDLIEEALIESGVPRSKIRSYIQYRSPRKRAAGTQGVVHLHGIAGRGSPPRALVLTEEHYHRMQRGSSWQERLVTRRLENSHCLFVGMSLSDPNLIRYLYGYKQDPSRRHAAVFVRQSEISTPSPVRAAREEAAAKRWDRCGVEAVFVDHYADAAQLLFEIQHRCRAGASYEAVSKRADKAISLIEKNLLLANAPQADFAKRQVILSEFLRNLLYALVAKKLTGVKRAADEQLALTLWLMSRDGKAMTGWAHSDRAHQDPATVAPIPLAFSSNWVAVQTVCRGVRVDRDRDIYASRWKFVRGLPLVLEQPTRLPIGCLTIASTRTQSTSVLATMPAPARAALHQALTAATRTLVATALREEGGAAE